MERFEKITIVILALAILLIGYLIYKVETSLVSGNSEANSNKNISEEDLASLIKQISETKNPISDTNLYTKINGFAQQSKTLDITGCKPIPPILKAKVGDQLVVKNMDSVERDIINPFIHIFVPASGYASTVLFAPGPGFYVYNCGNKPVGIVFISSK